MSALLGLVGFVLGSPLCYCLRAHFSYSYLDGYLLGQDARVIRALPAGAHDLLSMEELLAAGGIGGFSLLVVDLSFLLCVDCQVRK
jgi:hypothetical protein